MDATARVHRGTWRRDSVADGGACAAACELLPNRHSPRVTPDHNVERYGASDLPTVYPNRDFVKLGGLMSYGTDNLDLFRRAADLVDQILKGARPGEIPFYQPTKFELVINLNTAKTLGLEIPPSLLARADEVIE
jgi:hypothetical protein